MMLELVMRSNYGDFTCDFTLQLDWKEIPDQRLTYQKSWMDGPYVFNFEVFMMKLKDLINFMRAPHNFSLYDPDVKM